MHQALLEGDPGPAPGAGALRGTRRVSLNDGAAIERYTETFTYDPAGNLKRFQHQGVVTNWSTDMWISASSNRSMPAIDPGGTPVSQPESRFDAAGDLIRLPHVRRLEWDSLGRLARAVFIDRSAGGGPDDADTYQYDAEGTRIRKIEERLVAGAIETTEKAYLDGCEIKTIRRSGNVSLRRVSSHVTVGGERAAIVHRWTDDQTARETTDIKTPRFHYQVSDHLGGSVLELDASGALIAYEEYLPYGGTAFVASPSNREVSLRDYRYCSKERDDGTGLYAFGHRYYAPWMGRWLSPDPLGADGDGINLYQYVHGNPVTLTDPSGLQTKGSGKVRYVQTADPLAQFTISLTAEQRADFQAGRSVVVQAAGRDPVLLTRAEYQLLVKELTAAGTNVTMLVPARPQTPEERQAARERAAEEVRQQVEDILAPVREVAERPTDFGGARTTGPTSGPGPQGGATSPTGSPADAGDRSRGKDPAATNVNAANGDHEQAGKQDGTGVTSTGAQNTGTTRSGATGSGTGTGTTAGGTVGTGNADVGVGTETGAGTVGTQDMGPGTGPGNGSGDQPGSGSGTEGSGPGRQTDSSQAPTRRPKPALGGLASTRAARTARRRARSTGPATVPAEPTGRR